jgi:hypothetical protein
MGCGRAGLVGKLRREDLTAEFGPSDASRWIVHGAAALLTSINVAVAMIPFFNTLPVAELASINELRTGSA